MLMPHDIDQKLDHLLAEIRADFMAWERYYWNGVVTVSPEDEAERVRANLEWGEPSPDVLAAVNEQLPDIGAARDDIKRELREFMNTDGSVLLVRADAGLGKSTALIKLSQAVAARGDTVLYLMPYHRYWQDIQSNAATIPSLWYHWQSIDGKTPDGCDMCRFKAAATKWTGKGYPLMELCKRLCKADDHISHCDYRRQRYTPQPIKAGVHPHLVTGIAVDNIQLCVVDELPIGQFLPERIIKPENIQASNHGRGEVKMMLDILATITRGAKFGQRIDGKTLLTAIGSLLESIYKSINLNDTKKANVQMIPEVHDPGDVDDIAEWYVFDMLRLLVPEYHAWKNGLDEWLTRVYISHDGIHLLQRRLPWKGLPQKTIILDATGRKEIYEKLLNRPVKVVDIRARRTGKIFQITSRLNNVTSVLDKKTGKLRYAGSEAADLIRLIRDSKPLPGGGFGQYESIGIVTFKSVVEQLTERLDDLPGVKAVWYQGSRGTNVLEGVDALVCLGSPAIPDTQIIDSYAQLNYEPGVPSKSAIQPFKSVELDNGRIRPVRHAGIVEYKHINSQGLSPRRYLSGFWDYPELQAVSDLFTADELVQAIGRGRIPFLDCHVWLLTSQYTPLVIDAVYDNPGDALNVPTGIDWRHWLKIKPVLESSDIIRAGDLAAAAGVTRAWARHWIEMIAAHSPAYRLEAMGSGRGRKETVLLRGI